jgi:phosphonoacetate hydrolase
MSQVHSSRHRRLEAVIGALLDPALEPIVDMVVTRDGSGYEARALDGSARFRREPDDAGRHDTEVHVEGRNPLGDTATDRFPTLAAERATPWPTRTQQSYPYAHDQIAQLFDHPAAPNIVCLHTAAHNWEDHGGERGEHGSLGIVQVRAPFVLTGAGVAPLGFVPRACRLVDVAPTILALLGAPRREGGQLLARQDGRVLGDLIDHDAPPPDHVVGFLWDGCNANVLYDLVARGEAPQLARLVDGGTVMGHGAMASLPSVTLANHTTILTGTHPGHHGVLHNAWYDRSTGEQIITNSPATWPWAMRSLAAGTETIHQAVHSFWPGAHTVSINEPCDVGADRSTFAELRAGRELARPPRADELPFATERFVRPHKSFAWSSRVDHSGMTQAREAWSGTIPLPRFCFVNCTLTDAAFHQGGPYSEIATASVRDSDARMGRVLDAVERAGAWDRTAFFLVADHGMEDSNPAVTGDWSNALDACGVPYRDEAYGFIYVDP